MSNPIITFFANLRDFYSDKDITIEPWGESLHSNVFEIKSDKQIFLLYVKYSKAIPKSDVLYDDGFWGLNKNILERLNNSKRKWFIVFLHENMEIGDVGYVMNKGNVGKEIKNWKVVKMKEYKLHRKDVESNSKYFSDLDEFHDAIFKK